MASKGVRLCKVQSLLNFRLFLHCKFLALQLLVGNKKFPWTWRLKRLDGPPGSFLFIGFSLGVSCFGEALSMDLQMPDEVRKDITKTTNINSATCFGTLPFTISRAPRVPSHLISSERWRELVLCSVEDADTETCSMLPQTRHSKVCLI